MREKYIEERFPWYFEFGKNVETGHIDLERSGGGGQVGDQSFSPVTAEAILRDNSAMYQMLVKLALALDEVDSARFHRIWYEGGQ